MEVIVDGPKLISTVSIDWLKAKITCLVTGKIIPVGDFVAVFLMIKTWISWLINLQNMFLVSRNQYFCALVSWSKNLVVHRVQDKNGHLCDDASPKKSLLESIRVKGCWNSMYEITGWVEMEIGDAWSYVPSFLAYGTWHEEVSMPLAYALFWKLEYHRLHRVKRWSWWGIPSHTRCMYKTRVEEGGERERETKTEKVLKTSVITFTIVRRVSVEEFTPKLLTKKHSASLATVFLKVQRERESETQIAVHLEFTVKKFASGRDRQSFPESNSWIIEESCGTVNHSSFK